MNRHELTEPAREERCRSKQKLEVGRQLLDIVNWSCCLAIHCNSFHSHSFTPFAQQLQIIRKQRIPSQCYTEVALEILATNLIYAGISKSDYVASAAMAS